MDNNRLDPNEMKRHFDEHGFVTLPGFLDERELVEANEAMARIRRDKLTELPKEIVYYENKDDPTTLKQIQKLFDHESYFHQMMFGSRFEDLARLLLDEEVSGDNMQFFNKPPLSGLPTPPHQDGYFFKLKPNNAITMWVALEDVDEETGCLRYVDRSHHWGMRAHGPSGILGFSRSISDYGIPKDNENEIALPCRAGHLLAHHSLTIHRADGNRSKNRTRQALGFIYYGASSRHDEVAYKNYQEQLRLELENQGKI